MPSLRVLTDHEIFRRARRLRRPAALPPGRAVARHRRAHARRLRRPPRSRHRDLSRHPDDHRRASHARGGDRRVRGRRPAQRAAVPPRPARALSRRGRGRRPAAAAAAPARRQRLAASARADPPGDQADDRRAARSVRAPHGLAPATPFPPDTKWQRELESSFLYEDTPDQRKATDEVKTRHGAAAARWTGCWSATSATARPRSRCARRSRRCRAASRSRCWCRRRFSPSSTAAPSASGWPTSRSDRGAVAASGRRRSRRPRSRGSPTARSTS